MRENTDQNNSEYGLFSRSVSLFITFEISSGVMHVKEKAASLSALDTIFLIIEILEGLWCFLIVFSTRSEMLEELKIYC